LKWFRPLGCPEDTYQTSNVPSGVSSGYLCSTIIEIASPEWFHGWLGAKEAQDKLTGKPTGTFLLRFSTTPGSYSLSVAYSDTVGHWRINCEKDPFKTPIFQIDNTPYASLKDIVSKHRPGGEPLIIKSPKKVGESTCYLAHPLKRSEDFYNSGSSYS